MQKNSQALLESEISFFIKQDIELYFSYLKSMITNEQGESLSIILKLMENKTVQEFKSKLSYQMQRKMENIYESELKKITKEESYLKAIADLKK